MPRVDLLFPVLGMCLPTDHAYPLYAALSGLLPVLHSTSIPFGLASITGEYAGNGQLRLIPGVSHLRLRVPLDQVPAMLPAAGKRLRVHGRPLLLGAPRIQALAGCPTLAAQAVTIKNALDEEAFLKAVRQGLEVLGIQGTPSVPRNQTGPHKDEARRVVRRIKSDIVVGFSLLVGNLAPEDAIRLQEEGLGGRRRLGCGIFVSANEENPS